jgi:type IX secretion system substrate protein
LGTANLEVTKEGVLAGDIIPGVISKYSIIGGNNNTFSDVFALTPLATTPSAGAYYDELSTDPENPSDLFHVKMKAIASGSGEVSFPVARINNPGEQFRTLADLQYAGPQDFSQASENVYIEGPVTGEPYTAIELSDFEVAYKGGKVRIRWKTESETENLGFIIKRALVFGNDNYGAFEVIDTYIENDDLVGAGTTTKKTNYLYWDTSVKPGVSYAYVLQDVDQGGHICESEPVIVAIPESNAIKTDEFVFSASYPNPFNPAFVVPFELFKSTIVDIKLYDVSGRLITVVADREFAPGTYNLMVNGSDLSSGVYLLRTRVEGIVNTQKMLLVK